MLGFVRSRRHVSRIASQRRAQEPTQFLRNENLCQCWNFLWCFVIFLTVITQSELHFCYKNIIIVVFVVGFSYKLYMFLFDLFTSTNFVFDKTSLARLDHQPGRGAGGYVLILYISHICMAAPSGRVFTPFWCENVNTLCSFWSGIGLSFRGNYGSVWTFLSFQFQMSKKEREICDFQLDLNNFCVCAPF